MPSQLSVTTFLGSVWFFICNLVLYSKLKELYETIMKSEKLVKEMKKILQILPHGVIIAAKNQDAKTHLFTNEFFNSKIFEIRHKLQELDRLQVEIKSERSPPAREKIGQNLFEFLQLQ